MFTTIKEDVTILFLGTEIKGDVQFSATQHALTLTSPNEPAEVLTTNLGVYGYKAQEDTVFIKDWSEHQGVTASLTAQGIVQPVRELRVGPFNSIAWEVRVVGVSPAAADALDPALDRARELVAA
jgi:hypothetical protein